MADTAKTARLMTAVAACRAAVISLERVADEANYASRRAREVLTELELECEDDSSLTAGGTAVYLEPPRSQNPSP